MKEEYYGRVGQRNVFVAIRINLGRKVASACSMKLFTSLFARQDSAARQERIEPIFESDAGVFSIPTLSGDVAALEPAAPPMSSDVLQFHEDEWSQVEFLPASQFEHVRHILTEYVHFEQEQRTDSGWREAYIRQLARVPVISGEGALNRLQACLGVPAQPAPLLFSGSRIQGRLKDGFSLALGGDVTLYGFQNDYGIPVLGVHLAPGADKSVLSTAFATLNSSIGLILVDWCAPFVMVSRDGSGQPRFWRPEEVAEQGLAA